MKRMIWLALMLGACAHHGNLAHAPAEFDGQMAKDTAKAMRVVWPPQQTTLKTAITHQDPFLHVLVENLRADGYAVAPSGGKTGSELRYVIDRLDDQYYRVSVKLEGHGIHRLYQAAEGRLTPAGAWSRQD
jgi:hypothetical protein